MARSELAQRVAVAAVGIPLALGLIFLGRWVFGAALMLIAVVGALEFYRLAEAVRVRPLSGVGAVGAGAVVLILAIRPELGAAAPWLWLLLVGLTLVSAGAVIWLRGVDGRPLETTALTVVGAMIPAMLGFALLIRHLGVPGVPGLEPGAGDPWAGTALVVYAVGLTWFNDTCAYFAGRAWGRRKLIPSVSPGKTIMGAVAGVVGAVVIGAIFTGIVLNGLLNLPIHAVAGGLGGALIAVVAQIGDLFESVVKREAGVKDSGHLIPGHGGVLDRFDALFFTLPVAYLYLCFILTLGNGAVTWP